MKLEPLFTAADAGTETETETETETRQCAKHGAFLAWNSRVETRSPTERWTIAALPMKGSKKP